MRGAPVCAVAVVDVVGAGAGIGVTAVASPSLNWGQGDSVLAGGDSAGVGSVFACGASAGLVDGAEPPEPALLRDAVPFWFF